MKPSKQRSEKGPAVANLRQRWAFRLLAMASPVLLLAVLEVFLRLSGYGFPTHFFIHQRINGREMLTDNAKFGWRFFPSEIARTPQPVLLTPHKEPGTIRIFVFGESAAMGDPEPAFGLPRMLQAMLELSFPSNRFEVVNVAMTAINSHVIREIARDCAPLQGDVWLIYTGNNEVVGPYGSGTVFGRQVPGLLFIRTSLWLKQFRIVQLLTSFGGPTVTEWGGMEMFLKQQVSRDDPRMPRVYEHFRENLNDIIQIGSDSGAKVIVSTVAVNLRDCPPFASSHSIALSEKQRADWDRKFASAVALEESGQYREAQAALARMRRIEDRSAEDHYAELYFHLGRCEVALGSNDVARADFDAAKDYDTLRFRADNRIIDAIRQAGGAARAGVQLVDAEKSLAMASSNGIAGSEFFYEHVHLTFAGNYRLARVFFDEVSHALPAGVTSHAVAKISGVEDCARRLGWTDWNRLEIDEEVRKRLQQPPFTSQYGHAERDREWERRINELGESLTPERYRSLAFEYREALRRAPDDWVLHENFARLLEASGDAADGIREWKEVMRLLPHDMQAFYHVGNLLDSLGRSEEALTFLREAVHRNPGQVESRNGLALALASVGRTGEAERELNVALRLKPKFTEARVNLGQLLASQGRTAEAISQYDRALKSDPNSAAAHVNLGKLLHQRGDNAGAVSHYEAALRLEPRNAVAHYNLGNALLARDPAAAAQHYAAAVRAKPDFAEAHMSLGLEMAKAGKVAEAEKHLAEAVRLRPNSVDAHFNYGVLLANEKRFPEAAGQFSETLKLGPGHQKAREFLDRVQAR